jgi:hypothetical protein
MNKITEWKLCEDVKDPNAQTYIIIKLPTKKDIVKYKSNMFNLTTKAGIIACGIKLLHVAVLLNPADWVFVALIGGLGLSRFLFLDDDKESKNSKDK